MKKALVLVVAGFSAVGCGSEPGSNEGGGESEVGAVQEELLLQDSFSPSAALTVVRDRTTGDLGITIHGRIGVDDVSLVKTALLKTTFAESYGILHPEMNQLPAKVLEVSALLSAQHARVLATLPKAELALKASQTPASIDKSSSSFYNSACQTFSGGFSGWTPAYCSYQPNWHSICSYSTIGSLDKSVGWNESPYDAIHSLSGLSWQPTIPAWNWYVTEWGGNYSNRYACLTLNGSNTGGNLGITHHDYFTDQRNIGVNE